MEKVLFKEEQRFTQTWFWLIIAAAFIVPMIFLVNQLIIEVKAKSEEVAQLEFSLLLLVIIGSGLAFLFSRMKLIVEITPFEIRLKYPPFIIKWKRFGKEEIERFEVRKYKPITEYGGWGIKTNFKKRNIAYNVKGNIGLQLWLTNGKKILIGTQKKQSIEFAMEKFMGKEKTGMPDRIITEHGVSSFGRYRKFMSLIIVAVELGVVIVIFILWQLFKS